MVAGGHCAFNPEPLADFVDAFVLGDGEEAVGEVNEVARGLAGRSPPAEPATATRCCESLAAARGRLRARPLRAAPYAGRPPGRHASPSARACRPR